MIGSVRIASRKRRKNEEQAAKRTRLVEVKDGDEPFLEALNRLNGEMEKMEKYSTDEQS